MRQRVRLRRENGSQVLSIPRAFELEGEEVEIDEADGGLVIRAIGPGQNAKRTAGLIALLKTLEPLGEEDRMPEIEDYPPEPVDF